MPGGGHALPYPDLRRGPATMRCRRVPPPWTGVETLGLSPDLHVRGVLDRHCQRRFSPPPSHVEGTWPSTASWERPAATPESGGGQHGIWPRIRAPLHQPHLRRCQAARSTGHRHRPSAAPKRARARTRAPHSPAHASTRTSRRSCGRLYFGTGRSERH